jgi:predicted nucleic acid-binding protein
VTVALYLDTSVLAHALLGTDFAASQWFASVAGATDLMSSNLLRLETTRLLRREALDPALAEPYLQRIVLVSVNDQTLRLAGTFIPHIKTLDSIHLATLLLADPDATLATHDGVMGGVARQLGITVLDPLAS